MLSCNNTSENDSSEVEKNIQTIDTLIENPKNDKVLNHIDADRDKNCDTHFEMAMHEFKPLKLEIIHCSYWSTNDPIWLNHSFYFETGVNEPFFKDLIDHNDMILIKDEKEIVKHQAEWFLPKDANYYEGYYTEDDFDDFQIFRDLETGHIFIRGSQE